MTIKKTDALAGIRVLDFTSTIAGPHCTRMLADLGATVFKVEPPEGDMMRSRPPLRNGASGTFAFLNAGKRSVTLDLKNPAALEAIRKLVATTDIVVENYRPGVMKRLGLDYDSLCKIKPDLIYCAISGYGQTGPSAELPAYAPVIHAASGFDLAHISYQPGRTRPDNSGVFFADFVTGTYAFGGIMTALNQRHTTGVGQLVDVSMQETMLTMLMTEFMRAQAPYTMPSRPMFGPIATRDGFVMPAVANERTFQGLCKAAGRPDWIEDPRFKVYQNRRDNWGAFVDAFEGWSSDQSTDTVMKAFKDNGVPASRYRTVAEAMDDPQSAHRGVRQTVTDAGGPIDIASLPFRLSKAETRARDFSPGLGEHTAETLRSLGLDEAGIAAASKSSDG